MLPMRDLADVLRPRLDPDPRPVPAAGDRLAAVLALIVNGPSPEVVFTERAAAMSRHAGEVSFPGGLEEPPDDDLRATALRETHEELGIEPGAPDVLGALPAVHTFVSGILVTPFVAVLDAMPALRVSRAEIARVLTIPIRALAATEEERELREGDRVWKGWWYQTGDATVWGATGFMVHALLDLVREEAPWTVS
jgi:8-oxo-dGTP pyrophosphatase MutT (NUDIX family)